MSLLAGPNQGISLPTTNTVLIENTAPHRETHHIIPTGTKQTVITLGLTRGIILSSHTMGTLSLGNVLGREEL